MTTKWYTSAMQGAPTVSGSGGAGISLLDALLSNTSGFGSLTLTSLVVAEGIATATISGGHAYKQYSILKIAGATPSGLNGEKRILTVDSTTFTFDAAGISNQTATGTITAEIPSLGWSKAFSGTNLAAYTSQDLQTTGCLLRVDDTGDTDMRRNRTLILRYPLKPW